MLVNLNKARKARDKKAAEAKAAENRVAFGRTKAEKNLATAAKVKARRDVDGHKREP